MVIDANVLVEKFTRNSRYMSDKALPSFAAPSGGQLNREMLAAFHDAGVLILRDFASVEECQALRSRALELLDEFNPDEVHSVFSTTKQTQLDDTYFIESGDKIRFFLEEDAFDESGRLRQSKEDSLNKMGHAMHDLDPVFERFSAIRTRLSFTRNQSHVSDSGSRWKMRRSRTDACISFLAATR